MSAGSTRREVVAGGLVALAGLVLLDGFEATGAFAASVPTVTRPSEGYDAVAAALLEALPEIPGASHGQRRELLDAAGARTGVAEFTLLIGFNADYGPGLLNAMTVVRIATPYPGARGPFDRLPLARRRTLVAASLVGSQGAPDAEVPAGGPRPVGSDAEIFDSALGYTSAAGIQLVSSLIRFRRNGSL